MNQIWNTIALNFPGLGFINCDDEEDCIQGSGSGDGINNRPIDFIPREGGNGGYNGGPNGGSNNEEVFQVGGTDSEFFFDLILYTHFWFCFLYYNQKMPASNLTYDMYLFLIIIIHKLFVHLR